MVDIVNNRSVDWWEEFGVSSYFLPDNSSSTLVVDAVTLIAAASSSAVVTATQTTTRFEDATPTPVGTVTGHVYQAAKLIFMDADSIDVFIYILGADPACFLPNDVVDETYGPIADLIAWFLSEAVSETGADLTSYQTGSLAELTPGWLDLTGAATYAQRRGIVTEFWSQDGADVEVL